MVNYDAFAQTFSNSRNNLHWGEIDAIVGDIVGRGFQSLLDVGCGNGRLLNSLPSGIQYFGVDASLGMIEEAKKLHPSSHFAVIAMENIEENLRGEQYDAIVFLASFHHLETREDRKKTLLQVGGLLAPRGRLYMTNWNLLDQEKYQKYHRGNGDFDIKIGEYTRYYHGFTLDELEGLYAETGFAIVENYIFEGGRNMVSIVEKI